MNTKREQPPIWVRCHNCRKTMNITEACKCPSCETRRCWVCAELHVRAKVCDFGRMHVEPTEIPTVPPVSEPKVL